MSVGRGSNNYRKIAGGEGKGGKRKEGEEREKIKIKLRAFCYLFYNSPIFFWKILKKYKTFGRGRGCLDQALLVVFFCNYYFRVMCHYYYVIIIMYDMFMLYVGIRVRVLCNPWSNLFGNFFFWTFFSKMWNVVGRPWAHLATFSKWSDHPPKICINTIINTRRVLFPEICASWPEPIED